MLSSYAAHDYREKIGQEKEGLYRTPICRQVTASGVEEQFPFSASRQSAIAEGMVCPPVLF
jgi:hypothetical protein